MGSWNLTSGFEMSETNIFSILPEIWPEILHHLSPSDFHSLLNSSWELREQFKKERVKRLFPLVLPLLACNDPSINWQTFLTLRKVNKTAKEGVDSILETEFSPDKYWDNITTRDHEWAEDVGDGRHNLTRICERSKSTFNRVYAHKAQMGAGPNGPNGAGIRNAFLGGYLHVEFTAVCPNVPEEVEEFISYLTTHGHNVSFLKCSKLRTIRMVFSALPLVPNVKVLKLYTEQDVQDKDEFVKPVHYPAMPHLEFLDVEGFYDHETCQVNTRLNVAFVRKYGPQLKALNCNNQFFRGWWGLGTFYCRQLCNLQRLRVGKVGEHALVALSEANLPKLEEIHFSAESRDLVGAPEDLNLQQVLNVLNNYSEQLTSFQFYVRMSQKEGRYKDIKDKKGSMIPLKKLTKLSTYLWNIDTEWFWPFIKLKCPNLQELYLQGIDRRVPTADKRKTHTLLKSKAFKLAPKLRRIRVSYGLPRPWKCVAKNFDITRDGMECRRLWMK